MQFTVSILAVFGLFAAAQACSPAQTACGNTNGAPGPDGSIQVCNAAGDWQLEAQCGGPNCCFILNNVASCKC